MEGVAMAGMLAAPYQQCGESNADNISGQGAMDRPASFLVAGSKLLAWH